MSMRYTIVLSEALNREFEQAIEEAASSQAEILRKALQLYLAARAGTRSGLKLVLVDPSSGELQTEIIGL